LELVFGFVLGIIQFRFAYWIYYSNLALGIANLLPFGVVIGIALKKTKTTIRSIFEFRKFPFHLFITIVITCVGLSIVLSEIDNLFQTLLPVTEFWAALLGSLFYTDEIIGSLILMVVIAPLTEEILFRKIMIDGFIRNYRAAVAMIVASILFGIIHLNPWQFIGAVVMGIYLSWLYLKTRSIFPCIFAHAVFNFLPLLTITILRLNIKGYSSGSISILQTNTFQPIWFDIIGVLLLLIGILTSYKILKHNTLGEVKTESNFD
jgi:membrane protease YdiL (CAAX protease family)